MNDAEERVEELLEKCEELADKLEEAGVSKLEMIELTIPTLTIAVDVLAKKLEEVTSGSNS